VLVLVLVLLLLLTVMKTARANVQRFEKDTKKARRATICRIQVHAHARHANLFSSLSETIAIYAIETLVLCQGVSRERGNIRLAAKIHHAPKLHVVDEHMNFYENSFVSRRVILH